MLDMLQHPTCFCVFVMNARIPVPQTLKLCPRKGFMALNAHWREVPHSLCDRTCPLLHLSHHPPATGEPLGARLPIQGKAGPCLG